MVKEYLKAHHLVKISGKKYASLHKKISSFQKPKNNIPSSAKND